MTSTPVQSSRWVAVLLGLAAVILIAAAWVRIHEGGDAAEVSSARRELAGAVGAVRPSEGRLTGGFAYARFAPEGSVPLKSSQKLRAARDRIERALRKGGSPQALADAGVLNLLGGRHDKAIVLLEKATERSPAVSGIWSDLAAAYVARFAKTGRFADLLDALEAADRAVKLGSSLPEARFNLALISQQLSLQYRARAEWAQFLELAEGPDWRREGEERLAALFQPSQAEFWNELRRTFEEARDPAVRVHEIVALSPQKARELAEEELLGRWAFARSEGRSKDAAHSLLLARSLGGALSEARGDRMVAETVQAIDAAFASRADSAVDGLASGHARYQEGLQQYAQGSYEAAELLFAEATKALGTMETPFELWARFGLALCEHQRFRYDAALRQLDRVLEDARIERYPALRARALWVSGLIQGIRSAPAEALAAYRKSWEIFGRLGERGNWAAVSNLLAEVHQNLGDPVGAWKLHGLAVENLPWVATPLRKQLILEVLAKSLLADDRVELCVYFQEESLRNYSGTTVPAGLVPGLLRIAEAQYRQGDIGKALAFLHRAEDEVSAISAETQRQALLGDLLAWEGRAEVETNPDDAARFLTAAISSYERSEYRQQLVHMRLQRARAFRFQRRYSVAEDDLRRALELIDNYRSGGEISSSSFGVVRQVFDEMVLLQTLQNRPEAAFEYAEKGRAKLLPLLAASQGKEIAFEGLSLARIQEELPPGAVMVEFWLGESELFLWAVRRGGIVPASMHVDRKQLVRSIARFRESLATDDVATADQLGRLLYTNLVEPVEPSLRNASLLVFVPDQEIQAVPFAALQSGSRSKYLVEEHTVSVSPTASLYIRCLQRQRELSGVEPQVLAFGNPAFDRSLFPGLQPLPRSEAEARKIVGTYPAGKLILREAATRDRLMKEVGNWSVIHFGGHAVSNPGNPFDSALVLAPGATDSGVFYVRDLAGARLHGVRLMFLAACSTLLGDSVESGPSVAAPLLAGGVPAVVGTLWSVGDQAAEGLAAGFHRRFMEGGDAARALREVQLSMLNSPHSEERKASRWAAFEVAGSR